MAQISTSNKKYRTEQPETLSDETCIKDIKCIKGRYERRKDDNLEKLINIMGRPLPGRKIN